MSISTRGTMAKCLCYKSVFVVVVVVVVVVCVCVCVYLFVRIVCTRFLMARAILAGCGVNHFVPFLC